MDQEDFPTSPSKRQRTMSLEPSSADPMKHDDSDFYDSLMKTDMQSHAEEPPNPPLASSRATSKGGEISIPGLESATAESASSPPPALETNEPNRMLDALEQLVESASHFEKNGNREVGNATALNQALHAGAEAGREPFVPAGQDLTLDGQSVSRETPVVPQAAQNSLQEQTATTAAHVSVEPLPIASSIFPERSEEIPAQANGLGEDSPMNNVQHPNDHIRGKADQADQASAPEVASASQSLPTAPLGEAIAEAGTTAGPEWEVDSSPYESSSDSDSSDTTSSDDSDDEDADGDYAMLNAEEQARILMKGDGGSDDEGGKPKEKGEGAALRTANEKEEQIIPKPQIAITPEMPIEELGNVEGTVENTVLVKAKVSGEYQVLETGSLLCTKDRAVVGVVAETLGRVEQPLYTIRFTNDSAIQEAGLSTTGTTVFYVPQHSTFVFTGALRAVKGSDASNFHDEEVGDDEMEFSDDEVEAEHKRKLKMKRKGITDDGDSRGRGRGRGGRVGRARGDRQFVSNGPPSYQNDAAYGNGSLEMNYDDMGSVEDGYTPLARPTNYQDVVDQTAFVHQQHDNSQHYPGQRGRGFGNRGNRGDRGGRGGRGGRGRGRGSYDRSSNGGDRRQSYSNDFGSPSSASSQYPSYNSYSNQQQSSSPTSNMPPPQFPYQYQQQQPPNPPTISPQPSHPNFPFSPSPISPLPKQQFTFPGFGQQGAPGPSRYQQQQMDPTFMQNFQAQYQTPNTANAGASGWTGNQAAAAEVQRVLEEMRRGGS